MASSPISSDSGHSRRRVAALRCTSCTVVFEHPTEPAMLRWLIPRAVSLRISLYLIMSSPLSGDGATQCAPLGQSWSVMRAAAVGGAWNCGQWEMECRSLGPAVRTFAQLSLFLRYPPICGGGSKASRPGRDHCEGGSKTSGPAPTGPTLTPNGEELLQDALDEGIAAGVGVLHTDEL